MSKDATENQPQASAVPGSRADRLRRYLVDPHDHLLNVSPYGDIVMFSEAAAAIRVLEGKHEAEIASLRSQLASRHEADRFDAPHDNALRNVMSSVTSALGKSLKGAAAEEIINLRRLLEHAISENRRLRTTISEQEAQLANGLNVEFQRTNCAICGVYKHTPIRNDDLGGYVCGGCLEQAYIEAKTTQSRSLEDARGEGWNEAIEAAARLFEVRWKPCVPYAAIRALAKEKSK